MITLRPAIDRAFLTAVSLVLAAALVYAAAPVGPEIPLTLPNSLWPSLDMAADTSFVLAWNSFSPGPGIYVQRFGPAASPVGDTVPVADDAHWAAVALSPDGGFLVAYFRSWGTGAITYLRRFDADALPVGSEFQVSPSNGWHEYPAVAAAQDGSYVIVWYDETIQFFKGRRFAADGTPAGGTFAVSEGAGGYPPSLDMAADGSFVVAWSGLDGPGNVGIFARRLAADGTPLGVEFQVNTWTTNIQAWPDVSVTPSGDFVVVWHSKLQDGSLNSVFGRRYDRAGAPLEGEFAISSGTAFGETESYPQVALDDAGNFAVIWTATDNESHHGVFGRSYDALGTPLSGEFLVNSNTERLQGGLRMPMTSEGPGTFLATWTHSDGTGESTHARRLGCQDFPAAITGLEVGLEKGNLILSWDAGDGAESYHVLADTAPGGGFHTRIATVPCTGGTCGDRVSTVMALPADDRYYLIAGGNGSCGLGPRR